MQLLCLLTLFGAVSTYAQTVVSVETIKTVNCQTLFGPTPVTPVPKTTSKTLINTSTTVYITTTCQTVTTTPTDTITETSTDTTTDIVTATAIIDIVVTVTTDATTCLGQPTTTAVMKRRSVTTPAPDGVLYPLYPTQISCAKMVTRLTHTTIIVGATTTVTAPAVTETTLRVETTATSTTTTQTLTGTLYATVTAYPTDCPPANSTCSPGGACDSYDLYVCGSGDISQGDASCLCGYNENNVPFCFQNEYCSSEAPCVFDSDCGPGAGCIYDSCCGAPVCAIYDICLPALEPVSVLKTIPNSHKAGSNAWRAS